MTTHETELLWRRHHALRIIGEILDEFACGLLWLSCSTYPFSGLSHFSKAEYCSLLPLMSATELYDSMTSEVDPVDERKGKR